jgi:uncharacterized protein with NAD-binding domain and iron-sulfur cluster
MPGLPPPFHLFLTLKRFTFLDFREKVSSMGLFPILLGRKGVYLDALDRENAANWLRILRQPEAAVRYIWEPFCRAAVNLPLNRASAALLKVAVERCLLAGPRAARVGVVEGPAVGLLHPAAEEYLTDRGGEVRYGTRARRIVVEDGRVAGVQIHGGDTIPAGPVVCAASNLAAARLLRRSGIGGGWVEGLEKLSSSAIIAVHLRFERPVMDPPFLAMVGTNFEWAFSERETFDGEPRNRCRVSMLMGAADAHLKDSPAELAALARKELEEVEPGTARAGFMGAQVVRSPFATPALAAETGPLRAGARSAVPGLFLAGDYTATGLPATVEGACLSGVAAAEAVLDESA